jgi:hypothetical protein
MLVPISWKTLSTASEDIAGTMDSTDAVLDLIEEGASHVCLLVPKSYLLPGTVEPTHEETRRANACLRSQEFSLS